MKTMTKEQFAKLLNGNKYYHEINKEQAQIAKENNLIVLFGYSDDNLEIEGAVSDELPAWDGGEYALIMDGERDSYTDANFRPRKATENLILSLDEDYNNDNNPRLIRAEWGPDDRPGLSWRISSNMPCASFTIMEDGDPFCEGIVIDLDEIKPL